MRHLLGILLILAILLIAAWSAASLLVTNSSPPPTGATAQQLRQRQAELRTALVLSPTNALYWNQRATIALKLGSGHSPERRNDLVEFGQYRAAALAPSWEVPLLSRANQCAARQNSAHSGEAEPCRPLYFAVLQRNPTYGYAHYRYAEYLYDQAQRIPLAHAELIESLCQQYGQSLHLMRLTLRNNSWYRNAQARAYSRCLGLATDYDQARFLKPETGSQWQLMGFELGKKLGTKGWAGTYELLLSDLKKQSAGFDQYKALAHGFEKADLAEIGKGVLSRYLVISPSDSKAWLELVSLLLRHKKVFSNQEIAETITRARQQAIFTPRQMLSLASAANRVGHMEMALSILGKAIEADPTAPDSFVSLGNCYLAAGRPKEAIDAFKQAVTLSPNYPNYHVSLGIAYAKDKQYELAIGALQRALDLNPNDKKAKAALKGMGIY